MLAKQPQTVAAGPRTHERACSVGWAMLLVTLLLTWSAKVKAEVTVRAKSLRTDYVMALNTDSSNLSLQRATLIPSIRLSLAPRWQFSGALRLEYAGSETGLGTVENYDGLSQPVTFGSDARAEIEKAELTWRSRATMLTLGKQSVAWGVLDGLRVTDRFDAIRLRDAVFTEHRPERLTRWGARLRFERFGLRFDAAAAFDGTVSQNAGPDSIFFPRASRLRGGVPFGAFVPDLSVEVPNTPTIGLRASRTIGSADISLLAMRGPESEPVFTDTPAGIALVYPDRSLLGLTWERAAGSRIWRFEAAWTPDQPLNLANNSRMEQTERSRWLAGAGLDWKLPGGFFLNTQLGLDHVDSGSTTLTRPDTDVIATIRGHKDFSNATVRVSSELLSSLTDGDYAIRPQISWQVNDRLRLATGADIIRGDIDGLFGQFEHASRVWIGARLVY